MRYKLNEVFTPQIIPQSKTAIVYRRPVSYAFTQFGLDPPMNCVNGFTFDMVSLHYNGFSPL